MSRALAWCLVLVTAAPGAARAQTAIVFGAVRDSTGRPLPQALVRIPGGRQSAYTDATGAYRLLGVPRGAVHVRVELIGFESRSDTLQVTADSLRHDVTLRRLPGVLLDDVPRDTFTIAPVVVTAAKRSQLLDNAVTSVAVVETEHLQRRAVNTVDEAIDKAPGVLYLNGQVNIRGSTGYVQGLGSRVLLLVDGVPANQGDRGGINWDLVPLSEVTRVEIVKGAGSALYGSAALGGVVNVITRELAHRPRALVQVSGGVFADPPYPEWAFRADPGLQQRVDLSVSHNLGHVTAGVGAGFHHSDGYREQDARDRWNLSGKGRWQSVDLRTSVDLFAAWTRDAYQVPLQWCVSGGCQTGGQSYQPFRVDTAGLGDRTVSHKGFAQAVVRRTPSERLQWLVRGSWLRTRFTDHQRSGDDFSIANRFGLEVRGEVRPPGERVVTTVGVEGTVVDVTSNIFSGDHTQGEYAAYGESERRFGDARVTAGARMDFLATDGGGLTGVLSPRLGAVLQSRFGATRLSAGRAFRAPSIAEQFVATVVSGFRVLPNPALEPETAWSFEVGHRATAGRVAIDAAAFWTEASDLIEPAVDQVAVQIQFQNLARARLAGVVLAEPFRHLTASVNYLYVDGRELDAPGQPPLAFRPRHLLTLSADYAAGPATLGADFRFVSRMERVELFEGDERTAAKVLDLRAGIRRGRWAARLLVANALNYLYSLVPRTLAPVRAVSLTATWEY
jgi:iron complex outermembrane receptor protein